MSLRIMVALAALLLAPASLQADPLRDYVAHEDGAFAMELVDQGRLGNADRYTVRLTSQQWRGLEWQHWLSVLVPDEIKHPDAAVLIIAGGRNGDDAPPTNIPEARLVALAAQQLGVAVAVLQQVPNQPLFDGLHEDALIARTFDEFMREGDDDWPLLLPMTKSAVRGMDAVTQLIREQRELNIERFIVGGASKRGWTTYLTAAVDDRVAGIAPMVIDVLNLSPQMERQQLTYGSPSRMIRDYTERGLVDVFDTPRGQELVRIVDPYAYRDELTMPKLVLLGTNDPYWTVDAASLYFSDLPGPRHLHYGANVGHTLDVQSVPTLLAFFDAVLRDDPLPTLAWRRDEAGGLVIDCPGEPRAARLVSARSADRDFREARWRSEPLEVVDGQVRVTVEEPETGWLAYYVQIDFAAGNPGSRTASLTTTITVIPDHFPHDPQ